MRLGYVGLGKMGFSMVELLLERGHEVVVFDPSGDTVKRLSEHGAEPADSPGALVRSLSGPRLVWLMVPHLSMDRVIADLLPHLERGDTVIDGGNSPYKESMRRARDLEEKGVDFLDAGVSGGPSGARAGTCTMIGGRRDAFDRYELLFRDISVEGGYGYMGRSGAGHFTKMVHNGIEYGMMQAIAEGFALLRSSDFDLDLSKTADLYNHRSVIESRLLGWLKDAFTQFGVSLNDISGLIEDTGEGAWTVEAAKELGLPVPVIEAALSFRVESRSRPSYIGQIVSALRNQFGGHDVFKKNDKARQEGMCRGTPALPQPCGQSGG
jgi:6-phosphogluconate dehydrogenase